MHLGIRDCECAVPIHKGFSHKFLYDKGKTSKQKYTVYFYASHIYAMNLSYAKRYAMGA